MAVIIFIKFAFHRFLVPSIFNHLILGIAMRLMTETAYAKMTDKELVDFVLSGREDAMAYLLYVRYAADLRYYAMRYYNTLYYIDDLTNELFIKLKGSNCDWLPLANFQWKSSFRTWLCTVTSNFFLEKMKYLIGKDSYDPSIDKKDDKNEAPEAENQNKVMLLEAISRLEEPDYRFILVKQLEGYKPFEIAALLERKRRAENRLPKRNGIEVIPDAEYIHMIKGRALKKIKTIVEQIKKEWYGN